MKKKGKWSSIRTILVLIVLSLIALLGFGQPDFFKNVNSIVLAITGIASLIPAMNNFIGFSKSLKSS